VSKAVFLNMMKHYVWGISLLAEQLLSCQEWFFFMESTCYFENCRNGGLWWREVLELTCAERNAENLSAWNCSVSVLWFCPDQHRIWLRSFSVISVVKPTRCTSVSNLFYFGMTLYMFRTVFLSIVRSSRLYIQQYLTNACCCTYGLELLMMDGKTVRNM